MPHPCTLFLIDSKTADIIIEYIILLVSIGSHKKYCLFFVINLANDILVIFRLPWLKCYNPYIN